MEKVTANSTERFKDVVNKLEVNFRKSTSENNISIYAEIMQDGSQVGTFSYDKTANYMTVTIKPFASVSKEDISAIYAKAPEWIDTLIG